MAAVKLQVIYSFYTKYSKNSIFISAKTYEKYIIVSKDYYCSPRWQDVLPTHMQISHSTNRRY